MTRQEDITSSYSRVGSSWPVAVAQPTLGLDVIQWTSFLLLPSKLAPALNYTQIKQNSNEAFVDFTDKLYVAVEKEVEDANSREIIITSLAKANANEACKKVIMSLPFDPPPTLT